MSKIIIQPIRCIECEEFVKLVNYNTKKTILTGDYYHDKIDYQIKAFTKGLEFAGVDVISLEEDYYTCGYCG